VCGTLAVGMARPNLTLVELAPPATRAGVSSPLHAGLGEPTTHRLADARRAAAYVAALRAAPGVTSPIS